MIPAPTILFTRLEDAPNTPDNCLGDDSFAVEVLVLVAFAVEAKLAAIADCVMVEFEEEDDRDAVVSCWAPSLGDGDLT